MLKKCVLLGVCLTIGSKVALGEASQPMLFHGGQDIGNGGDVIACANGEVMFLDHWEGKTQYQFSYPEVEGQSYLEILENRLAHWSTKDPDLVEWLLEKAAQFEDEALFLKNVDLADIPDSEHIAVPKGCEIKQAVVFKRKTLPGERTFTLSKDLWDQLDEEHRGFLVLHEILYLYANEKLHTNSIKVRYLNALLQSKEGHDLSFPEYIMRLDAVSYLSLPVDRHFVHKGLQARRVHVEGGKILFCTAEGQTYEAFPFSKPVGIHNQNCSWLQDNGNFQQMMIEQLYSETTVTMIDNQIYDLVSGLVLFSESDQVISGPVNFRDDRLYHYPSFTPKCQHTVSGSDGSSVSIEFDPNGVLKKLDLNYRHRLQVCLPSETVGYARGADVRGIMDFWANGMPMGGRLLDPVVIRIQGVALKIKDDYWLRESGTYSIVRLAEFAELLDDQGRLVEIEGGQRVWLDENHRVTSVDDL